MARSNFTGESDSIADAIPHTPAPRRYRCFADNCPMPGSITVDGQGGPACAWHYGVVPNDIPKVTRVLVDWQCVSFEIREARRCLTGELATDPIGLQHAFSSAWERMKPLVAGWEEQLAPGTIRTSKGVDTGLRQGYGDWVKHLERFIGARVVEVLSTHHRRAA